MIFTTPIPKRGHKNLRQFRLSAPGCIYFVTVCVEQGSEGLACKRIFDGALAIFDALSRSGHARLHGMVIMPDHVHLLFELGDNTVLSGVVRVFKGRLSPELRSLSIRWQKGSYFDRLLRASDSPGAILRYIKMNPYQKGLVKVSGRWDFCFFSETARKWMRMVGTVDPPPPEWL